jgi:magnesium-transporting ATPase (P-type)
MGKSGTDVAREAAELVISDDHFGTITAGIEEGRIAYNNIRNVIYLLISTGAADGAALRLANPSITGAAAVGESIFNRLMIERTLVAALFMGVVGFGLFQWCLAAGWSEAASRNALLLLMVLFENVHLFNCRSETRSAFAISPLRSPVLMIGMVAAFSIHVAMTYLPAGNVLLATQPVDAALWLQLLMLSLPIIIVMELHKLSWSLRRRRQIS